MDNIANEIAGEPSPPSEDDSHLEEKRFSSQKERLESSTSKLDYENRTSSTESPLDELLMETNEEDRIVKHIMVIGFHHKHGYQVDYCYPPLEPNGPVFSTQTKPILLPSCWKTLPLLCLPDGSHNYDSDTIYFTMPDTQTSSSFSSSATQQDKATSSLANESSATSNDNPVKSNGGIKTIFGTACYRQIQADKLLNRTDDMTRVAVQKSVCVLSTKPLFGLIRSKLEMITHAYFRELDFSKVKILKLTYNNLNTLLSRDSVKENGTFLGLSARQLVSQFGCNTLVLFKAMLLEKKILFYKSPVRDLCSTIMSMCSLFTGLLECGGLDYSTCDLQLSPALLEALKLLTPTNSPNDLEDNCDESRLPERDDKVFFSPAKDEVVIITDTSFSNHPQKGDNSSNSELLNEDQQSHKNFRTSETETFEMVSGTKEEEGFRGEEDEDGNGDDTSLADGSMVDDPQALKLCRLRPEECGLPLQIFTRGSFCLPYLSISYLDLLSDTRIKSFVIGATNFLFKQRKEMFDVVVDMEENTITINDSTLKKCLALTTEDLRFMDYLSRHVKLESSQPKDEFDLISHDITKWVGGDEWIRYHFRLYTLYLLKAAKSSSSSNHQITDSFNGLFVQSWKQTSNNYKIWDSTGKWNVLDTLQSKHPFSSASKGINFSDMKLKLSYAVNSSERGRMLNQTLNGIGKWSIWNNIASAAAAATSAASGVATAAATTTTTTPAAALSTTQVSNDKQLTTTKQQQQEHRKQ